MSDTATVTRMFDISDTTSGEMIYDTLMVSSLLGVQESTIRKYCSLMQKHGYEFNKNSVGHRIFYAKDIEVIKKIIELKNSGTITLNEAVRTVLNFDIEDITDVDVISTADFNKILREFELFKTEQMNFNKQLLEQLEKQNTYIKNSIEERDRKLVLTLQETLREKEQKKKSIFNFWK